MNPSTSPGLVRQWTLIALLLIAILFWALFHAQINRALSLRLFLNSNNPREELFDELAKQSDDPLTFLHRTWATGKIVHRQFVAAFLKDNAVSNPTWLSRAEPLLLACATDADTSNREFALAALDASHNPRLFEAAEIQLHDLDPLVRQFGLGYLRKSAPQKALPLLIRLLDDPDLRIVTEAEVGLTRWTGDDFGIRTRMAIPQTSGARAGQIEPSITETIRHAVEQRKAWWQNHQQEYATHSHSESSHLSSLEITRLPAPDFKLVDLNGKSVRLSGFKGKVVLVNFWATWCTACLAEIPDLVALQNKMGDQVAILGIALDGVPDEHGDSPGEDDHQKSHANRVSAKAIRSKVERAVKAREINYPVLLDEKSSVGGQYNGGDLPTTVIIDSQGRVRRRFVGERSLEVFEAMIAEAQRSQ